MDFETESKKVVGSFVKTEVDRLEKKWTLNLPTSNLPWKLEIPSLAQKQSVFALGIRVLDRKGT